MPNITTRSGRTGRWTKMPRSFALFSGSGPSHHSLSSASFIIDTFGFRFSVRTGNFVPDRAARTGATIRPARRAGSNRCNAVALLPRLAWLRSAVRGCSGSRCRSLLCCLCHRDLLRFSCSLAAAPPKPRRSSYAGGAGSRSGKARRKQAQ